MSTTDKQVLEEMQYLLLEPPNQGASLTSDQWEIADWIEALNDAQDELLRTLDLLLDDVELVTTPHATRHPLPQGTIAIKEMTWRDSSAVYYRPLQPEDFFSLDNQQPDWETTPATRPRVYLQDEVPQLVVGTAPPTPKAGVLLATVTKTQANLSNTGVNFAVPDELVHCIKWRALETLLRRSGPAMDVGRADYCRQRWEEGILGARVMLEGGA